MTVKAGFCVAYDWHLLAHSLPIIYPRVDAICLSIDKNNKSWNGNVFEIDRPALLELIQSIDKDNKIKLLEESFYSAERTPIQSECYQRKRIADFLGSAEWIVQLDTDEIILNIDNFIDTLEKYRGIKRASNIHGIWINLIKQTSNGFIYSVVKTPPLATNIPVYDYGRTNSHFNIYTNTFLAHVTWARPEEEVYYKLKNWGHSHEFNGMSFFKIWQALDDQNWRYIKDFHPMHTAAIPQLYFQEAKNISELINRIDTTKHQLKKQELSANNIWISRLNKLMRKRS